MPASVSVSRTEKKLDLDLSASFSSFFGDIEEPVDRARTIAKRRNLRNLNQVLAMLQDHINSMLRLQMIRDC